MQPRCGDERVRSRVRGIGPTVPKLDEGSLQSFDDPIQQRGRRSSN